MNYENWQLIHKQAYEFWRQKQVSTYTPQEKQAHAWNYLSRHCSAEELAKLTTLAERYRTGEVLS